MQLNTIATLFLPVFFCTTKIKHEACTQIPFGRALRLVFVSRILFRTKSEFIACCIPAESFVFPITAYSTAPVTINIKVVNNDELSIDKKDHT